jgi:DNA-binding NarL/FixJ family response regulator
VRVVIAEDSDLLRESLAAALGQHGIEVAGMVGAEAELVPAVERLVPDAALVDIRLPPTFTTEGLRAAAAIRERRPRFPVLLLSHHVEGGIALQLLRDDPAGIGYLLKDRVTHVAQLVSALERLVAGGSVIDPEVVSALIGRPRRPGPLDELTSRERDVLRLMAEGRSNRGIGQELSLEEKTVEHHVGQVFSKLGLEPGPNDHRRVLAVLTWLNEPAP